MRDLLRHGDLALLGHGIGQARHPVASASTSSALATATSSSRSAASVISSSSGTVRTRVDGPGVEPLLDLHQADARLAVAGQDGPLDRRRTAPAGQQREVQVHHRDLLEQPRPG